MIAYDIYLKTSFELLIKERIRNFLFQKLFTVTSDRTADNLFESAKAIPLTDKIEKPSWFPKKWLDKTPTDDKKEEWRTEAINALNKAEQKFKELNSEYKDWQDHYGPQTILELPEDPFGNKLVKDPSSWPDADKEKLKKQLTPNTDHFQSFLGAAIWSAKELASTYVDDDEVIRLYASKIYSTHRYEDLEKYIWNKNYWDNQTDAWKEVKGTDLRRCNYHYYAMNFDLGLSTEYKSTFDDRDGDTIHDWAKSEMGGSELDELKDFEDYVAKKCNAKLADAKTFASMAEEALKTRREVLEYLSYLYGIKLPNAFVGSLGELEDLYYFAGYSLIENPESLEALGELTELEKREKMAIQGKEQIKIMFTELYTEIKDLISGEGPSDNTKEKLIEFDDLIDFSLFTLISEMDK